MNRGKIKKKKIGTFWTQTVKREMRHAVIISKSVKFLVYSCYHLKQVNMAV